MRPFGTDVAWCVSVCLSVSLSVYLSACVCLSLLVTIASRTKTDEPIEMPFELWTRVGPMNRVLLGGGPILPGEGANLGVVLPLKCIRLCAQQTPRQHGAAAMFTIDVKKRSNKNKKR